MLYEVIWEKVSPKFLSPSLAVIFEVLLFQTFPLVTFDLSTRTRNMHTMHSAAQSRLRLVPDFPDITSAYTLCPQIKSKGEFLRCRDKCFCPKTLYTTTLTTHFITTYLHTQLKIYHKKYPSFLTKPYNIE